MRDNELPYRAALMTAWGFIVLLAWLAWAGVVHAGGVDPAQMTMPATVTDRLWALVTDEVLVIGMLAGIGVGCGIGWMGFVRLFKPKPTIRQYPGGGYKLQYAYEDWLLLMRRVAVVSGMLWTFALNMIFLEGRYGWLAKVVVASVPSILAGLSTPWAYNKGKAWLKRKEKEHGLDDPSGPDDGDQTRL